MSEGGTTWKARKAAIREKFFQTLNPATEGETAPPPRTPGNVPSMAVIAAGRSALDAISASHSSDTSATATAPDATPSSSPASSTPAPSTSSSSDETTAWMVSPLGFTENNLKLSIVDPKGSLLPGLPSAIRESLEALATARAEPVHEVVFQIAQFFVDAEDERAEGSLRDCVEFYVRNYVGVR